MEDYERSNARLWDMHAKASKLKEDTKPEDDEWQVVGSKRPPKTQQAAQQTLMSSARQEQQQQKQQRQRQRQPSPPKRLQPQLQQPPPQRANAATGRAVRNISRRPVPRLNSEADNEAAQAWRNNEKERDTLRIPRELLLLPEHFHEVIARQHDSFITCLESQTSSTSPIYGIWGDASAARETKHALLQWISEAMSTDPTRTAEHKFVRLFSTTPEDRRRMEKAWVRDVNLQRFRRHPPLLERFGAVGTFHWPADEYRPEEILGASCEALDTIRMDCRCYITFTQENSTFKVCGTADDVLEASLRLRKTCFQIAARQIITCRKYLLYWPGAQYLPKQITLEEYEYSRVVAGMADPASKGSIPRGTGMDNEPETLEMQTVQSDHELKISMLQTLKKLHYYRGCVELRIRLGTFIATQFWDPTDGFYTRAEYQEMMEESQFTGRVTQELGDRSLEKVALSRLQRNSNLLLPNDGTVHHLKDVKPVYSAKFQFADKAGDICLTIVWREVEAKGMATSITYQAESKAWTRLDRDTESPLTVHDVSLKDLHTGLAWHFGIEASQPVDEYRLHRAFGDFARTIHLNPKAAQNASAGVQFVNYRSFPGVQLKRFQQRISYHYDLLSAAGKSTVYTLELTCFQNRTCSAEGLVVYEPRWGLEVYNEEWRTMFAQNADLKIGSMAEWDHGPAKWFPEGVGGEADGVDEDRQMGFEQLVENLKRIAAALQDANEGFEDLVGGMRVG